MKLTTEGNNTFESAGERGHDDLVLVTAIAIGAAVAIAGGLVTVNFV